MAQNKNYNLLQKNYQLTRRVKGFKTIEATPRKGAVKNPNQTNQTTPLASNPHRKNNTKKQRPTKVPARKKNPEKMAHNRNKKHYEPQKPVIVKVVIKKVWAPAFGLQSRIFAFLDWSRAFTKKKKNKKTAKGAKQKNKKTAPQRTPRKLFPGYQRKGASRERITVRWRRLRASVATYAANPRRKKKEDDSKPRPSAVGAECFLRRQNSFYKNSVLLGINQTNCAYLSALSPRFYSTTTSLNHLHSTSPLLSAEQPKGLPDAATGSAGRRAPATPTLDTIASRNWLGTPAGLVWLTTPPGYNWLETETGRDWYMFEGRFWLSTKQGELWSEAKFSRLSLWVTTPEGGRWLLTKQGYGWLRTRQGHYWLRTTHGSKWLQLNVQKLSTPSSRLTTWVLAHLRKGFQPILAPLNTKKTAPPAPPPDSVNVAKDCENPRLTTAEGHQWLTTAEGRSWLATEEASRWLSTTNGGLVWMASDDGLNWIGTPSGLAWLRSGFADQFNARRAEEEAEEEALWLVTPPGVAWLAEQSDVKWLGPNVAAKWLLTEYGQRWLTTDLGGLWLTTEYGTRWLATELGSTWLETVLGVKWLATEDAFNWLHTATGQKWVLSAAGLNWLSLPGGRKYHAWSLSKIFNWFDNEAEAGCLHDIDAQYLNTEVGTRWLFETVRGTFWLERTEYGAKWLNTEHGTQWWFAHVRRTGWLCPDWGMDLWLCTRLGNRWLASTQGTYWLCTTPGAKWLCTAHGVHWLCTAAGANWLTLNKHGQLPTPVFFKLPQRLHVCFLRWQRINWPQHFRTKLSFAQGRIWLTDEVGLSRFLLPEGVAAVLSTELGSKWLRSRAGRIWLDTQVGREWLRTPSGVQWYSVNRGGLITPSERVLNWILSSLSRGLRLLLRRPQ